MGSSEFQIRVVVVDDEELVRDTIALILKSRGCIVSTAEDGLAGLKLLRKRQPDVIISDLRMPRMSGLEFLSIVHRRYPHIATIAVTGGPISEMLTQAPLADVVIQKGHYRPDHLVETVKLLAEDSMTRRQRNETPQFSPIRKDGTILLTCNECLRSFSLQPAPVNTGVRTAECPACGWQIRYQVDSAVL
jgi:CheY-like chemotaxis protein